MIQSRYLFVSRTGKVIKIARPKDHKHKAVPQLAGEEVLEVILYYRNKDRKPHKLLMVEFDRFHLDPDGNYKQTEEDRKRAIHNFLSFGMADLHERIEVEDKPLPIPVAPIIPTTAEKKSLYDYINVKLPSFSDDAPYVVESKIIAAKEKYEEFKSMVKKSNKLSK
ncbi:hypothetical protein [Paenibacillus sp. 453mf]|uniref:hypothetical protein n=1 Tax=Paenibacillus sp. 453mf TaxID=1761874 RepID=UPI0008EF14AB|nr:hypothetical protein [Paenibacillus sp. 453mf]SFS40837.1 hypothetical protein SAMN04488601_101413 [Paenibacillus sp. 453mf]